MKRTKKIISVLLIMVLMVGLVACGGGNSSSKEETSPASTETDAVKTEKENDSNAAGDAKDSLRVGILVWKYDDTYGSSVRQAIEKYAEELGKEAGVEIVLDMQDGNDDQATQNDQATVMLANEPDVLIVNLCDVSAGQVIADMAEGYDIPVIFYNKEPTESSVITGYSHGSLFIGTDIAQAGIMQGEVLAQLWEEHPEYDKNGDGKVQYLMFEGEPNNPEAIARTEYSVKQAEELGLEMDLVNGEILIANWDTAKAQEQMDAVWANLGDQIEAVFCNNDDMALGVIASLNGVGYNLGDDSEKFIPIIGVDATDAALEAMNVGTMAGTVKQDGDAMGKAIVKTAINAGLGKDFLDGTDYELSEDGYSIRIEYQAITGK